MDMIVWKKYIKKNCKFIFATAFIGIFGLFDALTFFLFW